MKRHTAKNHKQHTGQYFTTNADEILSGFEHLVRNKIVCEPFAGDGDLTVWCYKNGAQGVKAYDIEPRGMSVIPNDSILDPWFEGCDFIVTNPPYLAKNKNKVKVAYDRWGQNDLYKCHMAALVASDIEEGLLILPANFVSESSSKIRDLFFSRFEMRSVRYYRYPVFDDATTAICVVHFKRWIPQSSMFTTIEVHYPDEVHTNSYDLRKEYGWIPGNSFFEHIYEDQDPLDLRILREGEGTNILISLLTNGKWPLGAHFNPGETVYASPSTFTTYQIQCDIEISQEKQHKIVELYNTRLQHYLMAYQSLFLANYMGATQKIKSRRYSNLLLSRVIKETLNIPLNTGLAPFFD